MLEGKISTSDIFALTSLPRRVISKCVVTPHICLANRKGEFIVTLKHGAVSTNSIIQSEQLDGVVKVDCEALESVIKALDSDDISIKSTGHRVRVFGKNTSISIFQYPMEVDDIDIIKDGAIGLKMKMKDYVAIAKFLPKACDMITFRGDHIAWKDKHNVYIVERKVPRPFFMPRGVLKSLTMGMRDYDGYVYQSRLKDGDIVLRWGDDDGPKYAIRYKEHNDYNDTHFDETISKPFMDQIGWMKIPDLRSFKDLRISDIKWTDHAISSYRNHNYNIVMKHNGTMKSEFITAVPQLPEAHSGVEMGVYDSDTIVMFQVGKWKLYVAKKRD